MLKTRLYLVHMLCGVVIAFLLGAHMVVLHLNTILGFFGMKDLDPTSWASMIGRSTQAVWAGLYIALLAFALYHALYGLRGIILEVSTSPKTERVINWVFIVGGILVFLWGSWVPLKLLSS